MRRTDSRPSACGSLAAVAHASLCGRAKFARPDVIAYDAGFAADFIGGKLAQAGLIVRVCACVCVRVRLRV